MKIAVATDDKKLVAEHFGESALVLVGTVEEGQVVKKEERGKVGHNTFSKGEHHPQTDEKGRHGFGPEAEQRHKMMFDIFKDCEVLIVNLIGAGAYNYFTCSGVRVIATNVRDIDEAIALYIKGKLKHIEFHVD